MTSDSMQKHFISIQGSVALGSMHRVPCNFPKNIFSLKCEVIETKRDLQLLHQVLVFNDFRGCLKRNVTSF